MSSSIHITTLVENSVFRPGLLAEHGLAFWIEYNGLRILFDTGQGQVLEHNARALGIQLEDMDMLALSHGHYDHTGGLPAVLRHTRPVDVFLHAAARQPKYTSVKGGSAREVGMSEAARSALELPHVRLHHLDRPLQIADGIMLTGPIPRVSSLEDTGGRFFLDAACTQSDSLVDDQALILEADRGVIVVLGCAHAGVISTLRYVQQITHGRPVQAVIGGMHLIHASTKRIETTIHELHQQKVQRLTLAHCTGVGATVALWNAFPRRCDACHVGSTYSFAAAASGGSLAGPPHSDRHLTQPAFLRQSRG
jgi:7,8-dihydropterin-6-yl-methyl-4-(beta-D-ribofuranosyl)aminobenzene 5'-phosphate synthase